MAEVSSQIQIGLNTTSHCGPTSIHAAVTAWEASEGAVSRLPPLLPVPSAAGRW